MLSESTADVLRMGIVPVLGRAFGVVPHELYSDNQKNKEALCLNCADVGVLTNLTNNLDHGNVRHNIREGVA